MRTTPATTTHTRISCSSPSLPCPLLPSLASHWQRDPDQLRRLLPRCRLHPGYPQSAKATGRPKGPGDLGMSDLLAPLLVVLDSESDAFWAFASLMQRSVFVSLPKANNMERNLVYIQRMPRVRQRSVDVGRSTWASCSDCSAPTSLGTWRSWAGTRSRSCSPTAGSCSTSSANFPSRTPSGNAWLRLGQKDRAHSFIELTDLDARIWAIWLPRLLWLRLDFSPLKGALLRLWEACWSGYGGDFFHLFVGCAIVSLYGGDVVRQALPHDEILLYFASLANHMDATAVFRKVTFSLVEERAKQRVHTSRNKKVHEEAWSASGTERICERHWANHSRKLGRTNRTMRATHRLHKATRVQGNGYEMGAQGRA